jgi:hypothetical protein
VLIESVGHSTHYGSMKAGHHDVRDSPAAERRADDQQDEPARAAKGLSWPAELHEQRPRRWLRQ